MGWKKLLPLILIAGLAAAGCGSPRGAEGPPEGRGAKVTEKGTANIPEAGKEESSRPGSEVCASSQEALAIEVADLSFDNEELLKALTRWERLAAECTLLQEEKASLIREIQALRAELKSDGDIVEMRKIPLPPQRVECLEALKAEPRLGRKNERYLQLHDETSRRSRSVLCQESGDLRTLNRELANKIREKETDATQCCREAALRDQQNAALRAQLAQLKNLRKDKLQEQAAREKAAKEEAAAPRIAVAREAAPVDDRKLQPIYFDFDRREVRNDQRETMMKNADWLKANPSVNIKIEGNCDERGSGEYNLALGQKRADSAQSSLERQGVLRNRMQTISYGKERPASPGSNEAAWSKNRRVDFVPVR